MRVAPLTRAVTLAGALALAVSPPFAYAERLPLRAYGTAEGLPSTDAQRIFCDTRGFVWFATRDGLARFDGARFVVYGTEQGLPVATVNDMVEARKGGYWVATNGGGVCWLDPAAPLVPAAAAGGPPLFRCRRPGSDDVSAQVNVLLEDAQGTLWAGTDDGLFRADADGPFARVDLRPDPGHSSEPPDAPIVPRGVSALAEDAAGTLWVGSAQGLFRRAKDGRASRAGLPRETDIVGALLHDRRGRIWIGFRHGLQLLTPEEPLRSYGEADGLPPGRVVKLRETADGHIWVATTGGLAEFDGRTWRAFTRANGLAHDTVTGLAEDHDGNLWIATHAAVMKLTRDGFVTDDETQEVFALQEGAPGEVFVVSGRWAIDRFDGERRDSAHPAPPAIDPGFAGQGAFRDRAGEWWLLSTAGVGRFPAVRRIQEMDRRQAPRVYTRRDGVPGTRPRRLYEDARGYLWLSADGPPGTAGVARWTPSRDRLEAFPQIRASRAGDAPMVLNEDASGALWVGFLHGGVGRLREGRFSLFPTGEDGAPAGTVTAIHRDDAGRLWIGTIEQGLTLVADPTADRPHFRRYTTAQGLGSNNVRCVTSDRQGRIYAGTVRGVDRLDPATGSVRRYTTVDGLPNALVTAALRDSRGRVWFGTRAGIARLTPVVSRLRSAPPAVWIGAVRIGGAAQPLPHVGVPSTSGLVVEPDRNQVQVEFFSLGLAAGETLRFQHRLEGAGDWSPPSEERAVQLAALGPGRHRLLVRAVNADGATTTEPASVELTVLPALWQRASVRLGVILLAVAGLYVLHRYRLRHALALERVRTRIASDLHDDIGASLSQIAILSELARRQLPAGNGPTAPLDRIAESSRELVDAMGDIVWAINPRRDRLGDLFHRMRRFASDTLAPRDIAFTFRAPETEGDRALGADLRRQVLLVFKEAVHNLARHSACRTAVLEVGLQDGTLVVAVADDGRGFDPSVAFDGHGLGSMRARAGELKGDLEVRSRPGHGTEVRLRVPLE